MSPTVFVTIAAKTELPPVRLLHASVQQHHPGTDFLVLLLDEPEGAFDPATEPFQIWQLSQRASWPRWRVCAFVCEQEALRQAATPVFLDELIAFGAWEKIVYLDARSYLYAPMTGLLEALECNRFVLTPRLTQPLHGSARPNHFDWLQAGAASTLLIGLTTHVENRYALRQWREWTFSFHHLEHPAHFVPLKPDSLVFLWPRSSTVFSAPGYGISYWNLHEQTPELAQTLVVFHFLGYDPHFPDEIAVGQDRAPLAEYPFVRPLLDDYRAKLEQAGGAAARTWRYGWSHFSNGVRVPPLGRELYRENAAMARRWERPFLVNDDDCLFVHLKEEVGPSGALCKGGIPRLWWEVWRRTPELASRFPEPFAQDRRAFAQWAQAGKPLGTLDPAVYDPAFLPSPQPLSASALQRDRALGLRGSLLRRTAHLARKTGGSVLRLVLKGRPELLDQLYFTYVERTTQAQAQQSLAALAAPRPSSEPLSHATTFGVNVAGYLTGEFGLAEAGRSVVRAIQSAEIPFVLRNYILASHRWGDQTLTTFSDEAPYPINLLMFNGPELPLIRQEFGDAWFRGKYNVGLWYWETQKIPDDWFPALKVLDEVWTTSAFVAEAVAKSTGAKVSRILNPIQIDETRVVPERAPFGLPEETFLFLFSFDFHSYAERKYPMAVVEAFKQAFGARKDVGLVIKCLNSATYPEKAQALHASLAGINAFFVDRYLERYEMFSLIAACNSYVSLHRTEGLGLGMAEAMYLGKPVIGTGYSGNMDFMNEDNSLLIRYKLIEIAQDYGVYKKGNLWADPDTGHATEVMQKLVEDPALAARIGAQARQDIHTNFSPQAAGRRIEERLREILRERA